MEPGLFGVWGLELAGLILTIIIGLALTGLSFTEYSAYWKPLFFSGLGLLPLPIYSAIRTKWLRRAKNAPLLVRIGAGTSIICGWVPPAAMLILTALAILFIVGAIVAAFYAALSLLDE